MCWRRSGAGVERLADHLEHVDRRDLELGRLGTTRTEARIESTSRSSRSTWSSAPRCQPARAARRSGSRDSPSVERRLLGQQVGVGADDRERRPQLVGHEGDELDRGPRRCALSSSTRASASGCRRPFSTIPARRSAIARQLGARRRREVARLLGLDVEHADDLVVPGERHRQHRGDEPPLVDAADPQEARVGRHVRDDQRLARRGDAAGDALAERDAGPADLVAVEAVRGRERQVGSVAVEQVERRDARRGARRASRRRPSRAARPRSGRWSPGGRPGGGSGAARAAPRPPPDRGRGPSSRSRYKGTKPMPPRRLRDGRGRGPKR